MNNGNFGGPHCPLPRPQGGRRYQTYNYNENYQQQESYQMRHSGPRMVGNYGGGTMMPPQRRVSPQQHMGHGNYPPQHQQPPMQYDNFHVPPQRQMPTHVAPPQQSTNYTPPSAASGPTPPTAAIPQPTSPVIQELPKVIMVTGYRMCGKTTVAKELAKVRGYEYVTLKSEHDIDDDDDEEAPPLTERLAALSRVLQRKNTLEGIVIDDALVNHKYEPYYVNFLLEKAGLHLDYLVIITIDVSDLIKRGVTVDDNYMRAHPESFEFAESLEIANSSEAGAPIAVIAGNQSLEDVVKDAIAEIKSLDSKGLPPIKLPAVEFIPDCPLVADPDLVDTMLTAQTQSLGLEGLPYGFAYVEPNYLMDYVQFTKCALLFKEYLVKPWIWGDKVSLLTYEDRFYMHLPSYHVVFQMRSPPTVLRDLLAELTKENESDEKKCLLCLEATMLNDVIYISDMMVLGKHMGSKMTLYDRVKLMKETFEKLPESGPLRLMEHFTVGQIQKCISAYSESARGVLFVNPDGIQAGNYESRNFIYPCEEYKSVKIRIWGGRMEGNVWVFDGYAYDKGGEIIIRSTSDDNTVIPVYISDEQVSAYSVNDGNIVECVLETTGAPQPTKGGRKGQKSQCGSFVFKKRCNWQVAPTTLYYQGNFVRKPTWSTEVFLEACEAIIYDSPAPPVD